MKQKSIDKFRDADIGVQQIFVDGRFITANSEVFLDVISPIDGKVIGKIPDSNKADVDFAVKVARRAFESKTWSRSAPQFRKKVLLRLADLIEENAIELAVLGSRDNGTEVGMALLAEPGSAASTFRFYAEAIDKINGEITPSPPAILSLIQREAIGVVAAIVPWNFPMMIGAWKIAPALAAGNTVVLKPSEVASLTLLRLGELAIEAGMPEGVLNVVTGGGLTTGQAIGMSNDVDVLTFTGSGNVGRELLKYSAISNFKHIHLELGGKSPNIVFDDCSDLETVARGSVMGMFRNSGQVCVAPSRLIVQQGIYDEFMEHVCKIAGKLKVGNPLDISNDIGAVASSQQMVKNVEFIAQAVDEGARLAVGGKVLHEDSGGYYLEPTIFDNAKPTDRVVQEEVFGPVMAVQRFKDEEDAVDSANGTSFGLASGVWTQNLSRAHRMVQAIQAGVVHVNCYGGADITVPLAGHKQSGNGFDRSLHAIAKYQNLKTAWINIE